MNFISICSGIDAASVAFNPLGWKAVAFSEIEPFPSAVLKHHYPTVPNFGDMTKFKDWPEEVFITADAIVGGPPCQSFSTAGQRAGLTDSRGNLTLTYVELINYADSIRIRHGKPPVIILYENVPGLLSDKTNAFGCFLAGLAGEDDPYISAGEKWSVAGCVFGPIRTVAWRVLDAQYFGLAQQRRRVFVVSSARAGFDPSAVLFEFDGLRRDSAPSIKDWKNSTPGATSGVTSSDSECTSCSNTVGFHPIAFPWQSGFDPIGRPGHISGTLIKNQVMGCMDAAKRVRRLTPMECERLQGFDDNYTKIPYGNKSASDCPDGPRYKALGNSWAVPNVHWIGARIDAHLREITATTGCKLVAN